MEFQNGAQQEYLPTHCCHCGARLPAELERTGVERSIAPARRGRVCLAEPGICPHVRALRPYRARSASGTLFRREPGQGQGHRATASSG
jgi:hypothetical protein